MKKIVYENATVYITIPNEQQKENIRKATEKFVHRLAKEGLIGNDKRRNNHRASGTSVNARKRAAQIKEKN